jgi:hypothetical protein
MSILNPISYSTFSTEAHTATAGTAIQFLIPGAQRKRTKVTGFEYTDTGTAHTLTFLRPLGGLGLSGTPLAPVLYGNVQVGTIVTAAALAAATSVIINRDPGVYSVNFPIDGMGIPLAADRPAAANDFFAFEIGTPGSGRFYVSKISAISASGTVNANGTYNQTLTLSTAVPVGGIAAGARVFWFGITTDTDPRTGSAHPFFTGGAASSKVTFGEIGDVVMQTHGLGEPMLFNSNNATNAGTLNRMSGIYADY